mmetsp:Transcript_8931/g.19933  ORF Transcript_8931/g.19933 Transcript_8931/m.19933 type:complete len:258 (+) Transcript_8931:1308-2081(+)
MDIRVHKFASELQIVIESKLGLGGVGDISCVRDRGLHDATRRADRIDAELEIVQIIQRVEDAEDIHPILDRDVAELENGIVWVVRVPDPVGTPQKHLERHVRNTLPHLLESLPRALTKEPEADIESGAAPILNGVARGEDVGCGLGNGEDILSPHARCQQGLVGVSPCGVGEEQTTVRPDCLSECLGASLIQHLLQPARRRANRCGRQQRLDSRGGGACCSQRCAAVDDEVAQVVEQLLAAVLLLGELEELRGRADE